VVGPTANPEVPLDTSGYPAPNAGGDPVNGYPGADSLLLGPQTPLEPQAPPAPASGLASISGVLVARDPFSAIPATNFYLTRGEGDDGRTPPEYLNGPDASRGDQAGTTDEGGRFSLTDIPPGTYFLYVWAPLTWREAEAGENDQSPMRIELTSDQQLAMGTVYVSWP
jgi:hypothetical protein